jgi:hypothetical protein
MHAQGMSAPLNLVARSTVSLGRPDVLAPLFKRLEAGKPVTVVAIGSSVTARAGGCTHSIVTGQPGSCCSATCSARTSGFLRSFFATLNRTWPHPGHRLYNAGVPASTPATFVECLETWLPRRPPIGIEGLDVADEEAAAVDLFIVEFVAIKEIGLLLARHQSRGVDSSPTPKYTPGKAHARLECMLHQQRPISSTPLTAPH